MITTTTNKKKQEESNQNAKDDEEDTEADGKQNDRRWQENPNKIRTKE